MARSREKQQKIPLTKILLLLIIPLLVLGWLIVRETGQQTPSANSPASVSFPHMHGLGYSGDGQQLVVAAHDGLRIFRAGSWSIPASPANDYMGYAPTDTGFYSSGHPGPSTALINPLGLIKSTDGGTTLTTLGFAGQIDFHVMGVGYTSHTIYVVNTAPTATLPAGLHYSRDEGKTWTQSAAQGLPSAPIQIAVHPTEPNVVAVATGGGALLSEDYGQTFTRIGAAAPVTAVTWSVGDGRLLVGGTTLSSYDRIQRQETALQTPTTDPVTALAVNPASATEIAVATQARDIYRSQDGGQTWVQIARAGQGLSVQ